MAEQKNKCVVVVEDEADLREAYRFFLETAGYTVLEACNGEEGLVLISKNSPDVIVTDIMMPKMTGLELLEKCKQLKLSVPIVVVSAFADPEKLEAAKKFGAFDFVDKPIQTAKFLEVVAHAACLVTIKL